MKSRDPAGGYFHIFDKTRHRAEGASFSEWNSLQSAGGQQTIRESLVAFSSESGGAVF